LVFKKNAFFSPKFGENRRKLLIITSTPDFANVFFGQRLENYRNRTNFWATISTLPVRYVGIDFEK
jgi:hypothetical protein